MKRIKKHLKILYITLAAGVCVTLSGCIQSAVLPGKAALKTDSEALAPYRERFDSAVEKISLYDYEAARDTLLSLADDLAGDKENDTDMLRADTDYALGRTFSLLGKDDESVDYYNSAYVYYKNLLGESASHTADAALRLAILSNDERNALRYTDEISESDADAVFKNIAYCISAESYIDLDNKKEADKFLDKIYNLTKSGADAAKDADSIIRLYGESPDISRTLGRLSLADQYRKAVDAKCDFYEKNNQSEEEINALKEKLATLTSDDLKNMLEKIYTLEDLSAVTMHYNNTGEQDEFIKEALDISEKIYPEGSNQAYVNIHIAENYYLSGDGKKFFEYLQRAKELVAMDRSENNRTTALIHLRTAAYYMDNSDYVSAVREAEAALDIYKNMIMDDTKNIAVAYNTLANAYTGKGDSENIRKTYQEAVEIFRELGDDMQLATTLRNLALVTNNTYRDHTTAMKYAREAISIVESLDHNNDSKNIAAVYMLMADITGSGDPEYKKIEEYCKKAYDCLQNGVGNTDQYAANYHYNYAGWLKDNARYDEAIEHYEEAEKLFLIIYDEVWKRPVDVYFDIGECLYRKKDYIAAREMFLEAMKNEEESIEHQFNAKWCNYFANNRQRALDYINDIDRQRFYSERDRQ